MTFVNWAIYIDTYKKLGTYCQYVHMLHKKYIVSYFKSNHNVFLNQTSSFLA